MVLQDILWISEDLILGLLLHLELDILLCNVVEGSGGGREQVGRADGP